MRYINLLQEDNTFETLWAHFTSKKRARARFDNYIGKHQAVDSFLSSLWRPGRPKGRVRKKRLAQVDRSKVGDKPTIVYGDGTFGPGGRGERNVPTIFIRNRASLQYDLVMVDEYLTTKKCSEPECHGLLVPAFRTDERGLVSFVIVVTILYVGLCVLTTTLSI